jgi:uncharacterized protein YegL
MAEDPLGGIARRRLHIALVLDTSKSMTGTRIEALNASVRDILPDLRTASEKNPQADVLVRQLEFSSGARWRTDDWKPISAFGTGWHYEPLSADGITDFGAALDKLTEELAPARLGAYNYPPVIVLITDGQPTDDWRSALSRFNASPFGCKPGRTVRAAINIANNGDTDVLQQFTGNPETVVAAHNSTQLTTFLKWATVTLSKHASQGRSSTGSGESLAPSASAPPPPVAPPKDPSDDIF